LNDVDGQRPWTSPTLRAPTLRSRVRHHTVKVENII
jgi:hypothetical protein